MIRLGRAVAPVALAAVVASCGIASSGLDTRPADLYSVMPGQSDVRKLMGDSTWWGGPPSFEVQPLDAQTTPVTQKFAVSQQFIHLGTGEQLFVRYTVFDKTSSATAEMTNLQAVYGTPAATSPKVGDQVAYYATFGTGGAPYVTRTFVRSGQIVLELVWTKKDPAIKVDQLAKNAKKFADPLRNLSKVHATPSPVDKNLLPPPGLDITLLGSTNLPLESFVVMIDAALPDTLLALLRAAGASTFTYGDYALNNDTHMEVQTALLKFPNEAAATDWANTFAPNPPDPSGIASGYIPIGGGTPAAGVYHYVFSSSFYGGLIVCKSSIDGEAATKECEDPVHNTAIAWKAGLQGLR